MVSRKTQQRAEEKARAFARVIAYLATDVASYVHGTTVVVDGGRMMDQGQGA